MKTIQIVGDSKFGGATYLLLEWCRYLIDKGVEVHALSADGPTVEQMGRIEGLRLISDVLIPREVSPGANMKAAFALRRLLRQEKYDVLHTYSSTPGFLGRVVARWCRVPVVTHHQAGFPVSEFSSPLSRLVFRRLEAMAINASTKSICVSHSVRQQAETLGIGRSDRLVTICNGIDIEPWEVSVSEDERAAFRSEIGATDDEVLIVATGRLAEQKGLTYLVQAVPQLTGLLGPKRFRVLFVGEGDCREPLEREIAELGVEDRVTLLGFRTDMPHIVACCDVFCSPSLWEGLSISIMEAMVLNKPIVTTTILPNAELIEHEVTGLLVPPKAVKELAEALAKVIGSPEAAQGMASAANDRVKERYTIQRMFDETWDLYNELLSAKR